MPAIDFSDVKGLEPIPEGVYEGTISYAQEGISQSGFPKIDIRWTVTYEGKDRLVFDTISFNPDALWRTKNTLKALGWGKEFSGEVLAEDLIGKVANIVVTIRRGEVNEETGEAYDDRNRVSKVKPLSMSAENFIR